SSHGPTPVWLTVHVIAKGTLITPVERFQVDDGGIGIPLADRPDGKRGETFLPYRLDDLLALIGLDPAGETDTLDTGVVLIQPQATDVAPPVLPGDLLGGGKQSGPASQHLMVGFQPLMQGLLNSAGLEFEPPFGNLAGIFAGVLPQPAGQRQAQQEACQYGVNRLALDEFLLNSGFAGQFAQEVQRFTVPLPVVL